VKIHLGILAALKLGAAVLCFVGLVSLTLAITQLDTLLSRSWARYTGYLDKSLRLMFMEGSARTIVRVQLVLLAVVLSVEIALVDIPYWYLIVAAICVGPALYLTSERKKRMEKLELQIDGFILALANSLKTVPGPAAAIQNVVPILQNPMKQEIERVVAEMRVGSTVEQGLIGMSARVGSRALDSALSSVLIGLQVGGNLPVVLETTAATIREMNRLDGVVKTKTSEGRAQLWVLAVFPFAICAAFNAVQPGYFDPLQKSFVGYIVLTVAMLFWVASLLIARKVLAVDI
jgi:tight adherence protein B